MKNSIDILTQEQLKEFLHYEPLTGIFTWLKLPLKAYSVKVGDIAGTKQHGYIHIQIFGKKQYAQRLAWLYMTGNWPSKHIDHKNGIRDCNIWCNLRDCTDSQNQFNAGLSSRNKSGYKGVSWRKATNKWADMQGYMENNTTLDYLQQQNKHQTFDKHLQNSTTVNFLRIYNENHRRSNTRMSPSRKHHAK